MSGWITPVVVIVIGGLNVLLARWRNARWFGRGSWLMVIGGAVLLAASFAHQNQTLLYAGAALLVASIVCVLTSIVRREMRLTLD